MGVLVFEGCIFVFLLTLHLYSDARHIGMCRFVLIVYSQIQSYRLLAMHLRGRSDHVQSTDDSACCVISLLLYESYANEHFRLQDLTQMSPGVRNSTPIIA